MTSRGSRACVSIRTALAAQRASFSTALAAYRYSTGAGVGAAALAVAAFVNHRFDAAAERDNPPAGKFVAVRRRPAPLCRAGPWRAARPRARTGDIRGRVPEGDNPPPLADPRQRGRERLCPGRLAARTHYAELKMPVAGVAGEEDRVIDMEDQSARLHGDLPCSTFLSPV